MAAAGANLRKSGASVSVPTPGARAPCMPPPQGLLPGRLTRVLRSCWIPVRLTVKVSSIYFAWFFLTLPRFVRAWVPHSSEILSLGFFYVFAQALGLMWLLVVNLCSIFSVGFVDHVQSYLSDQPRDWRSVMERMLAGYVQYCILRILFFMGVSCYTIGWEAFSDFPTVRRLVVGERGARSAGSANLAGREPVGRQRSAGSRRPGHANGAGDASGLLAPGMSHVVSTDSIQEDDVARETSRLSSMLSGEAESDTTLHRQVSAPTSDDDGCTKARLPNAYASGEPADGLPAGDQSTSAGEPADDRPAPSASWRSQRRRRRFFREATLMAPLLGLIACKVALSSVVVACHFRALTCDSSEGVVSLTSPGGMLNRGFRFALLVALIQWATQFIHLFPSWHRGLAAGGVIGWTVELFALPLLLVSACRFLAWTFLSSPKAFLPSMRGHHLWELRGLSLFGFDVGIVLSWQLWLLAVCLVALRSPEMSGFDKRGRLVDAGVWNEMSALFKYSFLVPTMLHFARGCFIFGYAGAQNDLLVIVCAYPLLLAAVWTLVWAVVVAPGKKLLFAGMVGIVSLASTVCSVAGLRQGAATMVVWLHLMRQYLKLFGNRKHRLASQQNRQQWRQQHRNGEQACHSSTELKARPAHGHQISHGGRPASAAATDGQEAAAAPQRKWGNIALVAGGLIALSFSGVLFSLSVVSSIQQRLDWFPNTIWFKREEYPSALVVDHLISRMRLQTSHGANSSSRPTTGTATGAAGGVSYAACGHLWHGLSVLDYALLSLASYFDLSDPSLPPLLDGMLPLESGLRWRLRSLDAPPERPASVYTKSRLRWIEVEIDLPDAQKPVLVIAVRGTDPVRVSDYVEDIRMWTEPVSISILSTIFPTVRAWPRRTAEMVIKGIHDLLDSLGLPDDKWSYTELVHHVLGIPREPYSQVVLTGHSLGGGMATVVAALTQLPVVGVTPPGIYWSIAKHNHFYGRMGADGPRGVTAGDDISSWMHHQSLTLVVENDWVNGIFDDHGGLVQMMTCDRSEESLQLACHMLEGTICHLLTRCGDLRGRFTGCSHEYLTDLKDQAPTTAARILLEAVQEVLPEHLKPWLAALTAWIERPHLPNLGIPKGKVLLLLGCLVLLLAIGGATEELLLL